MFNIDTTAVPPHSDVSVIAQAAQSSVAAKPQHFVRTFNVGCQDVVRVRKGQETLADQAGLRDPSRTVAFVVDVLSRLGYKDVGGRYVNMPAGVYEGIKTGVLEAPKHGMLTPVFLEASNFKPNADFRDYDYLDYKPDSDYLGRDRIVFWAEIAGKRYRVIRDIAVVENIDDKSPPGCVTGKFKLGSVDDFRILDDSTDFLSWLTDSPWRNLLNELSGLSFSSALGRSSSSLSYRPQTLRACRDGAKS